MTAPLDLPDWTIATSNTDTLIAGLVTLTPGQGQIFPVGQFESVYIAFSATGGTGVTWLEAVWVEDSAATLIISIDNLSAPVGLSYTGQLAVNGPYLVLSNQSGTNQSFYLYGSTHVNVAGRTNMAQLTFEGIIGSVNSTGVGIFGVASIISAFQGPVDVRISQNNTTVTARLEYVTRAGRLIIVEDSDFVAATGGKVAHVTRAVPAAFGTWQVVQESGATATAYLVQLIAAGIPF